MKKNSKHTRLKYITHWIKWQLPTSLKFETIAVDEYPILEYDIIFLLFWENSEITCTFDYLKWLFCKNKVHVRIRNVSNPRWKWMECFYIKPSMPILLSEENKYLQKNLHNLFCLNQRVEKNMINVEQIIHNYNSQFIMCWEAELNATLYLDTSEDMNIPITYFILSSWKRTHNLSRYSHTLVPLHHNLPPNNHIIIRLREALYKSVRLW